MPHMKTLLACLSLALMISSCWAAAPIVSSASNEALLDLPALVITPADAELIGISGLGRFENGHFRSLAEYAQIRADFLQLPLSEVESALADAGYLQGYTSNLGIPERPGDPQSPPIRVVFTSLYQYDTLKGAEAAFALNTDYSGVTIANVDTSLMPSTTIGDESVMTRTSSTEMEEEGPSDQIDMVFRVGNVIAATGIIDYGMTMEEIADPTPFDPEIKEQVEGFAEVLIERLMADAAGFGPGLHNKALTLIAANADPSMTSAGYRRIVGVDVPYFNGYQDDFSSFAVPEMSAAFEVAQPLGDPAVNPFDPYFASRTFLFETEQSATDFLAGITEVSGAISSQVSETEELFGVNAKVLQYDFQIEPDVTVLGYQVWQQLGTLVSMFILESADHRPELDVMTELSSVQSECLDAGCWPVQLPANW